MVPFQWTPETDSAFAKLKDMFSTAPILTHPDLSLQFVVEVNASDAGAGVVLSQHSTKDNELPP